MHYYNCSCSVEKPTSCILVSLFRGYIQDMRSNAFYTFCSKADHNVGVALVQLLKGQRGDIRPHVQRSADGSVYIRLLQIWSIIQYPETSGDRRQGKWANNWYWCSLSFLSLKCLFNAYLNVTLSLCHLRCRGKWLYSPISGTPHLACFISSRVFSSRLPVTFRGGGGGKNMLHKHVCWVLSVLHYDLCKGCWWQ